MKYAETGQVPEAVALGLAITRDGEDTLLVNRKPVDAELYIADLRARGFYSTHTESRAEQEKGEVYHDSRTDLLSAAAGSRNEAVAKTIDQHEKDTSATTKKRTVYVLMGADHVGLASAN